MSFKKCHLKMMKNDHVLQALVSKFHCLCFSSKIPKLIWMKPWSKNRNDRSACANIFSEFLLSNKFQHYLGMNAISYNWSYIEFYRVITYASYITYTYKYTYSMHWLLHHILIFKIHHSTRFSFLQITSTLLRN